MYILRPREAGCVCVETRELWQGILTSLLIRGPGGQIVSLANEAKLFDWKQFPTGNCVPVQYKSLHQPAKLVKEQVQEQAKENHQLAKVKQGQCSSEHQ